MNSDKIRIIVDNRAAEGVEAEHGFSVLIDHFGVRTIFDTGQSKLVNNLSKMEISILSFDNMILSHGHYDHTGGVGAVLERQPAVDVYLHPESLIPKYSFRDGKMKPVKVAAKDKESLNNHPRKRIHWVTGPVELYDNFIITGPIPRKNFFEDTGGAFFTDEDAKVKDFIKDDLAVIIKTDKGLVVVCGCCHSGIINTLSYTISILNEKKIYAIVGGLHLINSCEKRIQETIRNLNNINPDLIVPCHCTGELMIDRLNSETNIKTIPGYAGYYLDL